MNRKNLIRLFTFLGGIYFFLEYVLPEDIGGMKFGAYHDQISKGLTAVVTMAFGLGLINLMFIHGSQIAFLRKGWINSVALILGLLSMLTVAAVDWRGAAAVSGRMTEWSRLAEFSGVVADQAEKAEIDPKSSSARNNALIVALDSEIRRGEAEAADAAAAAAALVNAPVEDAERLKNANLQLSESLTQVRIVMQQLDTTADDRFDGAPNRAIIPALMKSGQLIQDRLNLINQYALGQHLYSLLYEGLFISLGSAMFALLGFYMAAAAYRAFRIRSIESALMMLAALVVMLGQIPFGLWIWDGFSEIRLWLLSKPSTAAFRAIKLGAAVAGLVMALRMWLSIESETFGERRS